MGKGSRGAAAKAAKNARVKKKAKAADESNPEVQRQVLKYERANRAHKELQRALKEAQALVIAQNKELVHLRKQMLTMSEQERNIARKNVRVTFNDNDEVREFLDEPKAFNWDSMLIGFDEDVR